MSRAYNIETRELPLYARREAVFEGPSKEKKKEVPLFDLSGLVSNQGNGGLSKKSRAAL